MPFLAFKKSIGGVIRHADDGSAAVTPMSGVEWAELGIDNCLLMWNENNLYIVGAYHATDAVGLMGWDGHEVQFYRVLDLMSPRYVHGSSHYLSVPISITDEILADFSVKTTPENINKRIRKAPLAAFFDLHQVPVAERATVWNFLDIPIATSVGLKVPMAYVY